MGGATGTGGIARQYSPYAGLGGGVSFDPTAAKTLYDLSDSPEFLFGEESGINRRSMTENLAFCTGSGYLGGAIVGGALGGYAALTTKPEMGIVDTRRLLVNRLLNLGGQQGRRVGNAWGVIGLFFATTESAVGYAREQHDWLNSVVAAATAGALYRSPAGPRASAVFATGGAILACLSHGVRTLLESSD